MLETFDLLRAQRDDDRANLVTPVKFSERMNDDRRSRDLDELFRDLPAESAAAAGGGNDGNVHIAVSNGRRMVGSGQWTVGGPITILPTAPCPLPLSPPMEPARVWVSRAGRGNRPWGPVFRAPQASGLQPARRSSCPPWFATRWSRPYRHFYRSIGARC